MDGVAGAPYFHAQRAEIIYLQRSREWRCRRQTNSLNATNNFYNPILWLLNVDVRNQIYPHCHPWLGSAYDYKPSVGHETTKNFGLVEVQH